MHQSSHPTLLTIISINRIRRIKCDEGKPSCGRCLSTGRKCDGYETLFRNVTTGPVQTDMGRAGSPLIIYRPNSTTSTADDVEKLAHLFKMKNRGSDIGYHVEAEAVLTAVADPAIRHALISLDVLYKAFQAHGYIVVKPNVIGHANVERGIEEYNKAVSNLSPRLVGEPSPTFIRTSLLCCQMFIGIEVRLANFTLAVQHFIRGLRIMYQYHSRPSLDSEGCITPSSGADLPLLDLFVIKLFASANPIAWQMERPPGWRVDVSSARPNYVPLRSQARLELANLSTQVAALLSQVAILRSQHQVQELQQKRVMLLEALQNWHTFYAEPIRDLMSSDISIRLRYAIAFSPFLHRILVNITSLALASSTREFDVLAPDIEALGHIAGFLTERRKEFVELP